jgi:gliding motility-associated lipoprotein GldH
MLLIFTVALAMTSCNRKAVYSHYEHTSIEGWDVSDSLRFDIPPVAMDGDYVESLGLRINSVYPFMGLTLIVEQVVYPSQTHYVDTLRASLMDHEGDRKGQGVCRFQYDFALRTVPLHANDSLHFCVRHNMRREMLTGVSDVGITLFRP